ASCLRCSGHRPPPGEGWPAMKIAILIHLESEASQSYDVVADPVAAALRKNGHKTSVLAVHGDVRKLLTGLGRRKPDLVFNLMEMFGKNLFGAPAVAGLLDLLGLCYTGGGPESLTSRRTKYSPKSYWPTMASRSPTSPSSRATPVWRPAATGACRCSSSGGGPTPRSASMPSPWSTAPRK